MSTGPNDQESQQWTSLLDQTFLDKFEEFKNIHQSSREYTFQQKMERLTRVENGMTNFSVINIIFLTFKAFTHQENTTEFHISKEKFLKWKEEHKLESIELSHRNFRNIYKKLHLYPKLHELASRGLISKDVYVEAWQRIDSHLPHNLDEIQSDKDIERIYKEPPPRTIEKKKKRKGDIDPMHQEGIEENSHGMDKLSEYSINSELRTPYVVKHFDVPSTSTDFFQEDIFLSSFQNREDEQICMEIDMEMEVEKKMNSKENMDIEIDATTSSSITTITTTTHSNTREEINVKTNRSRNVITATARSTHNGNNNNHTMIKTNLFPFLNNKLNTHIDSILIVNGIGGIGKTTLAVEYIWRYSKEYDGIIVLHDCDLPAIFFNNLERLATQFFAYNEEETSEGKKQKKSNEKDVQQFLLDNLKSFQDQRLLLVFDNVDTVKAIESIAPFVQKLSKRIHIIVTSRLQAHESFAPLFAKNKDEVDFLKYIYTVPKLSSEASLEYLKKRLNLPIRDVNKTATTTDSTKKRDNHFVHGKKEDDDDDDDVRVRGIGRYREVDYGIIPSPISSTADPDIEKVERTLKRLTQYLDGLPLALRQASAKLKEYFNEAIWSASFVGNTTQKFSHILDTYLEKYLDTFFIKETDVSHEAKKKSTTTATMDTTSTFQKNTDDSIFFDLNKRRQMFYKNQILNKDEFRFLQEKCGINTFNDYKIVFSNFSRNNIEELSLSIAERKKIEWLLKEEEEDAEQVKQRILQRQEEMRQNEKEKRKHERDCIGTTWKINYNDLSESAKKTLQFCSFLPSSRIMCQLLLCEESNGNSDPIHQDVWKEIENSSLMTFIQQGSYAICHPLVQAFVRREIPQNDISTILLEVMRRVINGYERVVKENDFYKQRDLAYFIFLQLQSIFTWYDKFAFQIFQQKDGQNQSKERIDGGKEDIRVRIEAEQHLSTEVLIIQLNFLEKIANHAWQYLHQASTAKGFLSSPWMEKLRNHDYLKFNANSKIAVLLHKLGLIYLHNNQFDETLLYLKKALEIECQLLGISESEIEFEGNVDLGKALHNLGAVYLHKGNYEEAMKYLQKAVNVYCRILDVEEAQIEFQDNFLQQRDLNNMIGRAYNNIGYIFSMKGIYDKALSYLHKALKIKCLVSGIEEEKMVIQGDAYTASSLGNIGILYYKMEDYDKALEYHRKALKIQYNVLGLEDSDVEPYHGNTDIASSFNNLGDVMCKKKAYEEALMYYKKALKIQYQIFGIEEANVESQGHGNSHIIATSLRNVGKVYSYIEEYENAFEYLDKALNIQYNVFGMEEDNVDIAETLFLLGKIHLGGERYDEALIDLQKAFNIQKHIYADNMELPALKETSMYIEDCRKKKKEP